jgi:hypothetical protein
MTTNELTHRGQRWVIVESAQVSASHIDADKIKAIHFVRKPAGKKVFKIRELMTGAFCGPWL